MMIRRTLILIDSAASERVAGRSIVVGIIGVAKVRIDEGGVEEPFAKQV